MRAIQPAPNHPKARRHQSPRGFGVPVRRDTPLARPGASRSPRRRMRPGTWRRPGEDVAGIHPAPLGPDEPLRRLLGLTGTRATMRVPGERTQVVWFVPPATFSGRLMDPRRRGLVGATGRVGLTCCQAKLAAHLAAVEAKDVMDPRFVVKIPNRSSAHPSSRLLHPTNPLGLPVCAIPHPTHAPPPWNDVKGCLQAREFTSTSQASTFPGLA
ncbi:hypothetical protein ACCO45_003581 [Purpureocillium lilacinum]|uniref:Uncharacterized protein n=1 Tax=Purpureocillium lilacinum TaxID=33203 RepID=A0ACC4E1F3_PURLI